MNRRSFLGLASLLPFASLRGLPPSQRGRATPTNPWLADFIRDGGAVSVAMRPGRWTGHLPTVQLEKANTRVFCPVSAEFLADPVPLADYARSMLPVLERAIEERGVLS